MDLIGFMADSVKFIRRMRLREFFQDVSSKPNEVTNEPDQSTERSMGEQAKKELNWTPPEGRCPELDRYARAIRECMNARFISHTHKAPRHNASPFMLSRPITTLLSKQQTEEELLSDRIEQTTVRKALYTSIPHDDGIAATASVLNTTNCQFPDIILQLIRLTMDYSLESVSFVDTRISIGDGHLSTSLYCKPVDNLMMLHFSSFHPKHIKTAIPYGQTLRIHRICSDEEERDGHLKVLKDAFIGTGYDAQLINRQFQHTTVKNRNDLLRSWTWDTSDRFPFVVQYFPGVEKLCHILHIILALIGAVTSGPASEPQVLGSSPSPGLMTNEGTLKAQEDKLLLKLKNIGVSINAI
eukprot:g43803.t1